MVPNANCGKSIKVSQICDENRLKKKQLRTCLHSMLFFPSRTINYLSDENTLLKMKTALRSVGGSK